MNRPHPISAGFRMLADAAGEEAAVALCLARGGSRMTIPLRAEGSVLAGIVGIDAATKIVDAQGGREITIPLEKRRIGLALLDAGWSEERVAVTLKVARRTVQYWVSRSGPAFPSSQIDLFA